MSHPPFQLEGLDHVVLLVRDMTEARHFYEQVLGCTVDRSLAEYGMLQLRAGASLIDLVDVNGELGRSGGAAPGNEAHNMDHFCLQVEGFEREAIVAWLQQHGATVEEFGTRYGALGSGPSQYLRDPEGNRVELKGPPE